MISSCDLGRFEVRVEYDARAHLCAKLCCEQNENSMLRSRSENAMQGEGGMVSHGIKTKDG